MERRIGFHVKSMNELKRIGKIPGVNLVELKPDKMRKNGDEMYSYERGAFRIGRGIVREIGEFCKAEGLQVQIHTPFEKKIDASVEEGLCMGIKAHHPALLERVKLYADLFTQFGIGSVVVMHPPQLYSKDAQICTFQDGLEYGREFLYMVDAWKKQQRMEFKVGVENMVPPKKAGATLGYTIKQLKQLLGNTETIGLTVDTGHRLLAKEMSVAQMFSIAPVVSMHLHSNPGVFMESNYDDDMHQFADSANLEHFLAYIRSIRRHQIPVTCEIDKLSDVPDNMIRDYVAHLRFMLE